MFTNTTTVSVNQPVNLNEEFFHSNISFMSVASLINSANKIHVLYHANCQDGLISHCLLEEHFVLRDYVAEPVSYGKEPPEIKPGSTVIILDFSYSPEVLNKIATGGNTVIVLDHHISAIENIAKYDGFIRFNYILSKEHPGGGECGASLVFRLINCINDDAIDFKKYTTPMANLVWLARQQDLWLHDGDTNSVALAFNYGISDITDDEMKKTRVTDCITDYYFIDATIEHGKEVVQDSIEEIRNILENTPYNAFFAVNGSIISMKCPLIEKKYASLTGSILCDDKPFSITYSVVPDGFAYSLRSKKHGINVADIANKFGGGGHTHAAGFFSPHTPDELFATEKVRTVTVGNAVGV